MNRLTDEWSKVAEELSLSIEIPALLELTSGRAVKLPILIKDFGASNGMVIFTSIEQMRSFRRELETLGYGYCVMRNLPEEHEYSIDSYADMLRDWGWSGHTDEKPEWLDMIPKCRRKIIDRGWCQIEIGETGGFTSEFFLSLLSPIRKDLESTYVIAPDISAKGMLPIKQPISFIHFINLLTTLKYIYFGEFYFYQNQITTEKINGAEASFIIHARTDGWLHLFSRNEKITTALLEDIKNYRIYRSDTKI